MFFKNLVALTTVVLVAEARPREFSSFSFASTCQFFTENTPTLFHSIFEAEKRGKGPLFDIEVGRGVKRDFFPFLPIE